MKLNQTYHGFRLTEERKIKEINSLARIFIHEKSGARLMHIENDDDNKVFSIGFRTPPEDSTGIPHILEHSVLCGSKKFPSKEPFVELMKGSLNTFLNALTFPDKTLYPVASRNEKDFFNLMEVYLDAVFYPNIYRYPEIFMQEGWHHELNTKDEEISYKGVVYNEMRGFFSSPELMISSRIHQSLFPNTAYGVESGGDPDVIPTLTREKFLDFHRRYYHPSNSYVYLYGDGNISKELEFIDEKYLKNFEKCEIESKIKPQKPFSQLKEVVIDYPISPEENEKDKTFLSLNFVVGKSSNFELNLATDILEHMLLETPASPLRKALLSSGIGKDVFGFYDNEIMQPVLSIILKNSNMEDKERFKKIVFETLEQLVKDGIDKKLIKASINTKEFGLREADFKELPKGLVYNVQSLSTWLYDEDPFICLEYEKPLEKIKTALTSDYFETLIKKYILKNNHDSLLILKPDKEIAERKTKEIKKKLSDYKSNLSEEEMNKLVSQTQGLKKRQSTPDSPEDLASIPLLSLKDINPKVDKLVLSEKGEYGTKVLFHPMFTNKIAYIDLFFDTTTVEQDLLPYVGLLADVLGKIGSSNYSYTDLSNEININTGGIEFLADAFAEKGNNSKYYPKLIVRSKVLVDKLPELFDLISDIIKNTKFDDKKRLKEIVQVIKSGLEMKILGGRFIASDRLLSYFSSYGAYREMIKGISYFKFISEIEKNFDKNCDDTINNLYKVTGKVFNKQNLLISVTSSEKDYETFRKNLSSFLKNMRDIESNHYEYKFNLTPENEGLLTPSNVQYVAKGYNINTGSHPYSGDLLVLKTIMNLGYLLNRVRVMGGAYGSFVILRKDGNIVFESYRDPNLTETLKVYDEAEDYIRKFNADKKEMTKYIIGTIQGLDLPLTPSMKGERSTEHYIRSITHDDLQKERTEVLNTKPEDIKKYADLIAELMKKNYFCVLGNESKIKENKEIFGKLVNVFE
jgi:hypothetical protein